ncbi:hypothetical protein [Streptomyces sp. NPDC002044]|uniref:hypothetical protein n=1 Tax=Streptomyces sp. NPDC002044 TaxID=3154662 RepID=UPI003321B8DB
MLSGNKAADTAVAELPTGRLVELGPTTSRGTPAGTAPGGPGPTTTSGPSTSSPRTGTRPTYDIDAAKGTVVREHVDRD